jgi:pimeloyl-[acyl-carrier protein] methyl ester esterase
VFIKQLGQGPELIMLHGWSMHSGVWHQFVDLLAEYFTLYLVDLPGHGTSAWQSGDLQMDNLVEQLQQQLPQHAYWLGWSLGGLIATAFTHRYPERVKKLILLASTPLFVQKHEWPCAVEADIFQQFADNLDEDQQQTLKRFLLLQARGAEQSKTTIRQLAQDLSASNPPHPQALKEGLSLLLNSDFRTEFTELNCPVLMLLGQRDTLVPANMLQRANTLNNKIETRLLDGAGHAPFIVQPQRCSDLVREFIND